MENNYKMLQGFSDEDLVEAKAQYFTRQQSCKSAIESLNADIVNIQQGYKEVWATGFTQLDNKLGGGFYPEQLIFLGAISSLGKTSFALQIADQIAANGLDVLLFSLEMSSKELLAKSISRQTYLLAKDSVEKEHRLTTRDVLNGNVGDVGITANQDSLFFRAEREVSKLNEHITYIIGENDIDIDILRYYTELHILTHNGRKPVVILDYLQILRASEDAIDKRLEKRLMTDDDVTKLKVLARDLKLPVLAISAFNRASYLDPVSMSSFKESSGIEYSSDVLLGMSFKGMDYEKTWITDENGNKRDNGYEAKQTHDNRVRELYDKMQAQAEAGGTQTIELKVLKNRTGSKGSVFYEFNPTYNYYEEIDGTVSAVASSSVKNNSGKRKVTSDK